MLHVNVLFHHRSVHVAVGDVLINVEQIVACAAKRPVVLVVPVLELHGVDVPAVEEGHVPGDAVQAIGLKPGRVAVAGKAFPVR